MVRKMAMLTMTTALCLCVSGTAQAEKKFGIEIYPKATTESGLDEACKKTVSARENGLKKSGKSDVQVEGACFKTDTDVIEEVVEFYSKQKNLKLYKEFLKGEVKGMNVVMFCLDNGSDCKDPGNRTEVGLQNRADNSSRNQVKIYVIKARSK